MGNKDTVAGCRPNTFNDMASIFVGHIETINFHELLNHKIETHAHTVEKRTHDGIAYLVVTFFIKVHFVDSAARGEYREFHSKQLQMLRALFTRKNDLHRNGLWDLSEVSGNL